MFNASYLQSIVSLELLVLVNWPCSHKTTIKSLVVDSSGSTGWGKDMACVRQTAGFVRLNAAVTCPQKRGLFRVGVSQGDDFAHRCHVSYLKTQFSEKSIKKILNILSMPWPMEPAS
jgi:hypothetical protein